MQKEYVILAFYHFVDLQDPHAEVKLQKEFISSLDIKCRLYISEQGINGQMSAGKDAAQCYMEWMNSRKEFKEVVFKIEPYEEHVFPRATIKYRQQLVALDAAPNLKNKGDYLEPKAWKEMLENEKDKVLLDVRNAYEWRIGHFQGAELTQCETFRDFKEYAERLKDTVDHKKTKVMMYCTGGIRCELYSSILKEKGFEKVYQLEGGIINYGQKEGSAHWLGKLFVFDDRLAVPLEKDKENTIGTCHHCEKPNDTYYNCANMDCNALFLCCKECLPQFLGCCQLSCKEAKRVRPYHQVSHKPFKKWYHYTEDKCCIVKKDAESAHDADE